MPFLLAYSTLSLNFSSVNLVPSQNIHTWRRREGEREREGGGEWKEEEGWMDKREGEVEKEE